VFPAQHFVLTHAHPGRTSRSVTHRSKPSTLNFGVFFVMGFRKRSCNLLVWGSLSILLSLGPGCHSLNCCLVLGVSLEADQFLIRTWCLPSKL
jgi:hypothetical protein